MNQITLIFICFAISVFCFSLEKQNTITIDEIYVEGGKSIVGDGIQHVKNNVEIPNMYVSKYKVTWKLFAEVYNKALNDKKIKIMKRGVFATNLPIADFNHILFDYQQKSVGVEISNGHFKVKQGMDQFPVTYLGWYGAALFCNYLSEINGYTPCYNTIDWSIIPNSNGYRMPKDEEWEYFARGGKLSKNFQFAGSDDPAEVAWFINNSKGKSHEVGKLKPNELGLYDISGNINEFCTEVTAPIMTPDNNGDYKLVTGNRIWRGGSYLQTPVTTYFYRQNVNNPDYYLPFLDVGLRVIRIKND